MRETLSHGPVTVNELAALVPITRPGVTRHLRVLRQAGLVGVCQEAQRRIYSLRPSRSPRSMNGSASIGLWGNSAWTPCTPE
jgi:DNA-binding transcriptional ArsR family regulator